MYLKLSCSCALNNLNYPIKRESDMLGVVGNGDIVLSIHPHVR